MELHIVHKTIGGFAREDTSKSSVVGAYTDQDRAKRVALVAHGEVETVTLDEIPNGYVQALRELGYHEE